MQWFSLLYLLRLQLAKVPLSCDKSNVMQVWKFNEMVPKVTLHSRRMITHPYKYRYNVCAGE